MQEPLSSDELHRIATAILAATNTWTCTDPLGQRLFSSACMWLQVRDPMDLEHLLWETVPLCCTQMILSNSPYTLRSSITVASCCANLYSPASANAGTVLNSFMRRIRHTPTRMKGSEAYADTDDTDHIKCYRALSLPSDATKQARHSFSKSVSTTALRSPLYDFSHVVA